MENKKNVLIATLGVIVFVSVGSDLVSGYFESQYQNKLSILSERYSRSTSDEEKRAIVAEVHRVRKYPQLMNSVTQAFTNDTNNEDVCWDWAWNSPEVVDFDFEYFGGTIHFGNSWWGRYFLCLNS